MSIMKKLGIAMAMLVVSSHASANWTDYTRIQNIKMLSGGTIEIRLEGFSNNQAGCNSDIFVIRSGSSYEARMSMIMALHMADAPVRFSYYGCDSGYITVSSIQTRQ